MEEQAKIWKKKLIEVHNRYKYVITLVIIAIGFLISFLFNTQKDTVSMFVSQFGSFIAGVVAVTFLYEWLIKDTSNAIFLDDMGKTFENTLQNYNIQPKYPIIHENGRLSIQEKVAIIKRAKSEYIEVALAMRTFTGYFTQRSTSEFKDEIEFVLKTGVNFKFYLLNPDSETAKFYASARDEPDLINNIRHSKNELVELKNEFERKGYAGKFEIFYYTNFPYYSLTLIDRNSDDARALISNYLPLAKRAEMPVIEIIKKENPNMMRKYIDCFNLTIRGGKKIA